ncbi:MAG: WD40 repeat domain-containing protein, partial [Gemmataceae bacterium]
ALSADGKLLVSADALGVVRLWETETGKALRQSAHRPPVAVALGEDGVTLAIARAGEVLLQDVDTGREIKTLKVDEDQPLSLVWADKQLVVGYRSHSIRCWDVDQGTVARTLGAHITPVVALAYAPTAKRLASADQAGNVRLWDVEKGTEVRRLGGVGRLPTLVFSPSGKTLATSNTDGMVSLWNAETGAEEKQLLGHDGPVRGLAFAPDGKTLVSAGQDHLVRLWELASGKQVLSFGGHAGPVQWVRFAPDGRTVLSASADCTLLNWDLISKFEGMRVGPGELDNLWKELASSDGPPAYRAAWTLVAAPKQSVPFVRDRLRTFIGVDPQRISRLIANLNHDDFMVRERATEELEKLGQLAEQALQKTMTQTGDLEVLRRIERILEKQMAPDVSWHQERLRVLRAINVLEKIGTSDARTILENLAKGAPEEVLMREARASLDRLNKR